MLGAIHPINNGAAAKRFRRKRGIRHASREGVLVTMGYPAVKYHKTQISGSHLLSAHYVHKKQKTYALIDRGGLFMLRRAGLPLCLGVG
jgi:hypothetical protein